MSYKGRVTIPSALESVRPGIVFTPSLPSTQKQYGQYEPEARKATAIMGNLWETRTPNSEPGQVPTVPDGGRVGGKRRLSLSELERRDHPEIRDSHCTALHLQSHKSF